MALIIITLSGCAHHPLKLSYQVSVPDQFKTDPPGWIPPNGEPEHVRYSKSYEAFYWNCIMVKSKDLQARCPASCSGTAAATFGCFNGGWAADNQVVQLLEAHSAEQVQEYLQTVAARQETIDRIKAYFPEGPQPERITVE
jgi:hypothetical protein